MCLAVVGNESSAGKDWKMAAARAGFDLRTLKPPEIDALSALDGIDALVIVAEGMTGEEQELAVQVAARKGIPSLCARCEGAVFCR